MSSGPRVQHAAAVFEKVDLPPRPNDSLSGTSKHQACSTLAPIFYLGSIVLTSTVCDGISATVILRIAYALSFWFWADVPHHDSVARAPSALIPIPSLPLDDSEPRQGQVQTFIQQFLQSFEGHLEQFCALTIPSGPLWSSWSMMCCRDGTDSHLPVSYTRLGYSEVVCCAGCSSLRYADTIAMSSVVSAH